MTKEQVKEILFSIFLKWMHGQTVSQNENGETIYSSWDVEVFVKKIYQLLPHIPIQD